MKLQYVVFALSLVIVVITARNNSDLKGWTGYVLKNEHPEPYLNDLILDCEGFVIEENGQGVIIQVVIPPEKKNQFESGLQQRGVSFTISSLDVGAKLDKERFENEEQAMMATLKSIAYSSSDLTPVNDVTTYFAKHNEINSWLTSVASNSNGLCSTQDIGLSYQQRTLRVLKCSSGGNKKVVFLDSAIHAREHLAPATLTFIIKALVEGYKSKNAEAVAIFNKFDFHFLPVVNPDGYDFTFTANSNRYWRKTRQPYGRAFGADPNRNFDSNFGGPSTSRDPNSDLYCGPSPFSEPETRAMANYLSTLRGRMALYISFHTYGQLWLTPPGFTRQLPSDHNEMMRVANAGANALSRINGNRWRVGQPANVGLYEAAGGSYDWVKQKLGVRYSYTLELRPQWPAGIEGFLASPSHIAPSGREVYAAILATANALP